MKHALLILVLIAGACSQSTSTNDSTDTLDTSPDSTATFAENSEAAGDTDNPGTDIRTAGQPEISVSGNNVKVSIDRQVVLVMDFPRGLSVEQSDDHTTVSGYVNIDDDTTSLVGVYYQVSATMGECDFLRCSDIMEGPPGTETVTFGTNTFTQFDCEDNAMHTNYRTNGYMLKAYGACFSFTFNLSSSYYSNAEDGVSPVPYDEAKYTSVFEKFLESVRVN